MTATNEHAFQFVGQHSIRFEPPDIVFSQCIGDMTIEQTRQMMHLTETFTKPENGLVLLVDISRAGRQDPAVSKDEEIMRKMALFRALVYFGGAFHHRTMIEIFQKVAKFFKFPIGNMPVHVFATEAEARAWIDDNRRSKA